MNRDLEAMIKLGLLVALVDFDADPNEAKAIGQIAGGV